MKKFISLLLMFWLPLFFSAAGFASTSMQAGELVSAHTQQQQYATQGSDHCQRMAAQPCSHKDCANSHSTCQHCGLCMNLVFYPSPTIAPVMAMNPPLSNHVAWVSSPHLTSPEQRPPISL